MAHLRITTDNIQSLNLLTPTIEGKKKKKETLNKSITKTTEMYVPHSLPMVGGKSKVNTVRDLSGKKKKNTKRIMGWKEKFISKSNREILIKTVAQAILTYSIGIFKIPKAPCDNIVEV